MQYTDFYMFLIYAGVYITQHIQSENSVRSSVEFQPDDKCHSELWDCGSSYRRIHFCSITSRRGYARSSDTSGLSKYGVRAAKRRIRHCAARWSFLSNVTCHTNFAEGTVTFYSLLWMRGANEELSSMRGPRSRSLTVSRQWTEFFAPKTVFSRQNAFSRLKCFFARDFIPRWEKNKINARRICASEFRILGASCVWLKKGAVEGFIAADGRFCPKIGQRIARA